MEPREVPLGGPRAMHVRRTLPQRHRSLIGAWCFLDHYGPDEVADSGGMSVAPHPHTGLQTVSWLFTGEVEHRDSAGNHAMVRPGELNLMTAGRGISHSEVSPSSTSTLHGAQLWLALPESARHTDPGFDHYAPPAVSGDGWTARVFLGSLLGSTSPVSTYSPLLGRRAAPRAADRPRARRRPDVRARRPRRHRCGHGRPPRGQAERARLRPARNLRAVDHLPRRAGAGARARRRAVRGVDRDVVELRGPQPRGGRGLPRRVAGADHR